jgi:hypothetical protein
MRQRESNVLKDQTYCQGVTILPHNTGESGFFYRLFQAERNRQRDERERLQEAQRTEARLMDNWIRNEMKTFERSLTPSREQDHTRERSYDAPERSWSQTRGGDGGGRRRTLAPVPYF